MFGLGCATVAAMLAERPYMRGEYHREKTSALTWLLSAIIAGFVLQISFSYWSGSAGERLEEIAALSVKGLGLAAVTGPAGEILGVFTDGDLRRLIERGVDLRALTAGEVMHHRPRRVSPDALAAEAASLMEHERITTVLVADADGRLVGAVNSNDLMRAKVI